MRCALAFSDETAQLGRLHNNANVVSLGARMYPLEDAVRFAEIFLSTAFSAEPRHERRIAMLTDYERSGVLPPASARWLIARPPVRGMRGRASALAALRARSARSADRRRRRDAVGERAAFDPRGGVADHEVALGVGQVLGGGTGDVTGPHRAVDPDL